MPSVQDAFALNGPARFTTADGQRFTIPALLNSTSTEQRLIPRKRPGVSGAPIDTTGADPRVFDLVLAFFPPGHGLAGVVDNLYPQEHARFMAAAERPGGTWTVYVPGRGEKRCQVKHVGSRQSPGEREYEEVTLTLWEDTEDERVTDAAFTLPTASVQAPSIVRQMAVDGPRLGVGGSLWDSIGTWAAALEAAARAPIETADAVATAAARTIETASQASRALAKAHDPLAFGPLADADTVGLTMQLVHLQDAAARQRGASTIVERRYAFPVSIFDVALREGQDAAELATLNARLPSLFMIPPGVPVRVRDQA